MTPYQLPDLTSPVTTQPGSYLWNGVRPGTVSSGAASAPFVLEPLTEQPVPAVHDDAPSETWGWDDAPDGSFDEGYAAGLAAARAEAAAAVDAARKALADTRAAADAAVAAAGQQARSAVEGFALAVAGLDEREDALLDSTQAQLVAVAFEIAKALLGRELEACDEPAVLALVRAAGMLPERGELVLRFHPDDAAAAQAALRDRCPDELAGVLADRAVTVVADSDIERYGCIADCGPARVDAQWSVAVERVRSALGL